MYNKLTENIKQYAACIFTGHVIIMQIQRFESISIFALFCVCVCI